MLKLYALEVCGFARNTTGTINFETTSKFPISNSYDIWKLPSCSWHQFTNLFSLWNAFWCPPQDLEKVGWFQSRKNNELINILIKKIVDGWIGELVNWCHEQDTYNLFGIENIVNICKIKKCPKVTMRRQKGFCPIVKHAIRRIIDAQAFISLKFCPSFPHTC